MQLRIAYSFGLIAEEITSSTNKESVITHATDSASRKHVEKFAPPGLGINRDIYLPLPTIQIASETENIAEGIQSKFDMMACASKLYVRSISNTAQKMKFSITYFSCRPAILQFAHNAWI